MSSQSLVNEPGALIEISFAIQAGMVMVYRKHDAEYLGLLDQDTGRALGKLASERSVHLVGFIPAPKRGASGSGRLKELEILVYGLLEDLDAVGSVLADSNIFLQHPQNRDESVPYDNPHYLKRPGAEMEVPEEVSPARAKGRLIVSNDFMAEIFSSAEGPKEYSQINGSSRIITPLKSHQMKALAMMLEKEHGELANPEFEPLWKAKRDRLGQVAYYNVVTGSRRKEIPRSCLGGLLADEMGLGKTLSLLSLIAVDLDGLDASNTAGNRRGRNTKGTTLVIAPKSALGSWDEQIRKHVRDGGMEVYLYHGNDRATKISELSCYDVVFTTYSTLCAESTSAGNRASRRKDLLHSCDWRRVILDEGQSRFYPWHINLPSLSIAKSLTTRFAQLTLFETAQLDRPKPYVLSMLDIDGV